MGRTTERDSRNQGQDGRRSKNTDKYNKETRNSNRDNRSEEEIRPTVEGRKRGATRASMSKKERRALKQQKLRELPFGEVVEDLKPTWVKVMESKTPKEERSELVGQLSSGLTGLWEEIIVRQVPMRMACAVVKYGSREQIQALHKELKGKYVPIIKDQNSYRIAIYFLRFRKENGCDDIAQEIIDEIVRNDHLPQVALHQKGSDVLNEIYIKMTSIERDALFIACQSKVVRRLMRFHNVKSIRDVYEKMENHNALNDTLARFVRKSAEHGFMYLPFYQFCARRIVDIFAAFSMQHCKESLVHMNPHILQFCLSNDGSRLGCASAYYLSAQGRRQMLRFMNNTDETGGVYPVELMIASEHGWKILAVLSLWIDDVTRLKDRVFTRFATDEIWDSEYLKRFLAVVLSDRPINYLTKKIRTYAAQPETSKKEPERRRRQIFEALMKLHPTRMEKIREEELFDLKDILAPHFESFVPEVDSDVDSDDE
ncbi:hypothetical protein PCE1_001079 [Barthelona sp. PCE]